MAFLVDFSEISIVDPSEGFGFMDSSPGATGAKQTKKVSYRSKYADHDFSFRIEDLKMIASTQLVGRGGGRLEIGGTDAFAFG